MQKFFTAANITRLAVYTAISYILYMFVKFPIAALFPSFLELQISDMPAALAVLSSGPLGGIIVITLKILLKLPFTTTGGIGELADFMIGIAFVLPLTVFYKKYPSKKGVFLQLVAGILLACLVAAAANYFILMPFYLSFVGGLEYVLGSIKVIFPAADENNFYAFYLLGSVVPFNILRGLISGAAVYILYARLWKYIGAPNPNVKKKTAE